MVGRKITTLLAEAWLKAIAVAETETGTAMRIDKAKVFDEPILKHSYISSYIESPRYSQATNEGDSSMLGVVQHPMKTRLLIYASRNGPWCGHIWIHS